MIETKLQSIFQDIFKDLPETNFTEISQKNFARWDSLNHLKIMFAIESEFGISVEPEESLELTDVSLMIKFIEEKKA